MLMQNLRSPPSPRVTVPAAVPRSLAAENGLQALFPNRELRICIAAADPGVQGLYASQGYARLLSKPIIPPRNLEKAVPINEKIVRVTCSRITSLYMRVKYRDLQEKTKKTPIYLH